MLKHLIIFVSGLLLTSCKTLEDPKSPASSNSVIIENVSFIKLGTYRGFTDEGTEYQKSYYLSRYSRPAWGESRSFCNSYGFEMLTLETLEEQQSYLTLFESSTYLRSLNNAWYWVDSIRIGPATDWYWTKSGKKISFPIPWLAYQPDNWEGIEYCLNISKLSMNAKFGYADAKCSNNANVACQKIEFTVP